MIYAPIKETSIRRIKHYLVSRLLYKLSMVKLSRRYISLTFREYMHSLNIALSLVASLRGDEYQRNNNNNEETE